MLGRSSLDCELLEDEFSELGAPWDDELLELFLDIRQVGVDEMEWMSFARLQSVKVFCKINWILFDFFKFYNFVYSWTISGQSRRDFPVTILS